MRGYGLPRNDDVAYPDISDILLYGLAGFKVKMSSRTKKVARRIWKKKARKEGKNLINQESSTNY